MNITILIEQLQKKHTEFNQNLSVEEYQTKGEEDFIIWLNNEIKTYLEGL